MTTRRSPKVFNKHRDTIPAGAIYVGRPTIWGNPFKIGFDGSREEVIELYRTYITADVRMLQLVEGQLRGKDLVCWCAPMPCHADVLLELANL